MVKKNYVIIVLSIISIQCNSISNYRLTEYNEYIAEWKIAVKKAHNKKLIVVLEEGSQADSMNRFIRNVVSQEWKFNDSIEFKNLSEVRKIYESGNKAYMILQLAGYSWNVLNNNHNNTGDLVDHFWQRQRANENAQFGSRFTFRWELFFVEKGKWFLYKDNGGGWIKPVGESECLYLNMPMSKNSGESNLRLYLKGMNSHLFDNLSTSPQ